MGSFKFDGDMNDISENQLEFIGEVLEKRGFKHEKVDIRVIGKDGDNYVANLKRITVEKEDRTFRMIAKIAPQVEALRLLQNTAIMFQNEHVMYTHVLPKFTELEKTADIPDKERLRYAKCYGTFMEMPEETILLEDLNVSDYIMLDRFVSLTDDTVGLVLKNFAKLHSYSYVLKTQEPDTYTDFKSQLRNVRALMDQNEQAHVVFQSIEDDIMKLVDDKYKIYIKGSVSQVTKFAAKIHDMNSESKYSVIQQGDSWNNNILFRFKDDQAVDCCMIDYQLSTESSPVSDIQFMIFNCTDYKTRSKYYHDWIDYYHTELDKSLVNFGLKVKYVFPKDQLDADLRRYGKFSFGMSLFLATILLREAADATKLKAAMLDMLAESAQREEKLNSTQMSALDEKTVLKFKKRVEGLIDSFVELEYLN